MDVDEGGRELGSPSTSDQSDHGGDEEPADAPPPTRPLGAVADPTPAEAFIVVDRATGERRVRNRREQLEANQQRVALARERHATRTRNSQATVARDAAGPPERGTVAAAAVDAASSRDAHVRPDSYAAAAANAAPSAERAEAQRRLSQLPRAPLGNIYGISPADRERWPWHTVALDWHGVTDLIQNSNGRLMDAQQQWLKLLSFHFCPYFESYIGHGTDQSERHTAELLDFRDALAHSVIPRINDGTTNPITGNTKHPREDAVFVDICHARRYGRDHWRTQLSIAHAKLERMQKHRAAIVCDDKAVNCEVAIRSGILAYQCWNPGGGQHRHVQWSPPREFFQSLSDDYAEYFTSRPQHEVVRNLRGFVDRICHERIQGTLEAKMVAACSLPLNRNLVPIEQMRRLLE